jgi:hypothetical protein
MPPMSYFITRYVQLYWGNEIQQANTLLLMGGVGVGLVLYKQTMIIFVYIRFYIRFWLPAAAMAEPSQRPATKKYVKTRGCNYSF